MAGLGISNVALLEQSASKGQPAWGYGIRYDYGCFTQKFNRDGEQVE